MIPRTGLAPIVLATVLLGCGQEEVASDPRTVSTVEAVAVGSEECPAGGQKILTGVDENGNGILEANEVTQVAYVCNGQSAVTCTTLEGSVTIRNSLDWANLVAAGCTRITGTLEIAAQGAASLGAPSPLVQVGSIRAVDNDLLTSLDFPALTTVDDSVEISNDPSLLRVSFPALTTVGWDFMLVMDTALEELDLRSLTTVNDGLYLEHLYPLASLDLPELTTGGLIGYSLNVTRVDLPKLARGMPVPGAPDQFGPPSVILSDCEQLTEVNVPALTAQGYLQFERDVRLARVSAPLMTGGGLSVRWVPALTDVDLPALADGSVRVEGAMALTALELPALVSGWLAIVDVAALAAVDLPVLSAAGRLEVDAIALTSLNAPAIASVDWMILGVSALASVNFPELTTVTEGLVLTGASGSAPASPVDLSMAKLVSVRRNAILRHPALASVELPLLSAVGGLEIVGSPSLSTLSLPALASVTYTSGSHGALYLGELPAISRIELPSLASVTGDISMSLTSGGEALDSISLPALTSAGGLFVSGFRALTSLSLPAWTTMGPRTSWNSGQLMIADNASLPRLEVPSLTGAYDVMVARNAALADVSMPALASVLYSLYVTDNPILPQCRLDALLTRLSPPPPIVIMERNDTTATCQ